MGARKPCAGPEPRAAQSPGLRGVPAHSAGSYRRSPAAAPHCSSRVSPRFPAAAIYAGGAVPAGDKPAPQPKKSLPGAGDVARRVQGSCARPGRARQGAPLWQSLSKQELPGDAALAEEMFTLRVTQIPGPAGAPRSPRGLAQSPGAGLAAQLRPSAASRGAPDAEGRSCAAARPLPAVQRGGARAQPRANCEPLQCDHPAARPRPHMSAVPPTPGLSPKEADLGTQKWARMAPR